MYEVNYTVKRGEVWERLVIPKDRRTHRKRVPVEAAASILLDGLAYVIPSEITSEGGVLMSLTEFETKWLPAGVYTWDMVIKVSRSALLTSTPLAQTLAVGGTITVSTQSNITPLESDVVGSPLTPVTYSGIDGGDSYGAYTVVIDGGDSTGQSSVIDGGNA